VSLIPLRPQNDPAAVGDLDACIRLDPDSRDVQTAKQIRAATQRKLADSHPS